MCEALQRFYFSPSVVGLFVWSGIMMKQCENCIYKKYKKELTCCCANELGHALTELIKQIPVIGKYIKEHECTWFIEK